MAISKRDQNRVTVGMGVNDTDRETPLMLLVDPVTRRLLVTIQETTDPSGVPTTNERDQNHVPTQYGINNSDRTTPLPLLIHAPTGTLEVDLLVT